MRVLVSAPRAADLAARARRDRRVRGLRSRSLPDSELVRLNADLRLVVPSSASCPGTLSALPPCGLPSERGFVDPTLLDALEAAGYTDLFIAERSERGAFPGPCAGTTASRCEVAQVRVDDGRGTIERPPGLRLDSAGPAGFAADRVAAPLASPPDRGSSTLAGDIRFGGRHEVLKVGHPLAARAARLQMTGGAVATSSIVRRACGAGGRPPRPSPARSRRPARACSSQAVRGDGACADDARGGTLGQGRAARRLDQARGALSVGTAGS